MEKWEKTKVTPPPLHAMSRRVWDLSEPLMLSYTKDKWYKDQHCLQIYSWKQTKWTLIRLLLIIVYQSKMRNSNFTQIHYLRKSVDIYNRFPVVYEDGLFPILAFSCKVYDSVPPPT